MDGASFLPGHPSPHALSHPLQGVARGSRKLDLSELLQAYDVGDRFAKFCPSLPASFRPIHVLTHAIRSVTTSASSVTASNPSVTDAALLENVCTGDAGATEKAITAIDKVITGGGGGGGG